MRIYGKNSVLERIKTNPRSIKKIYIEAGHAELSFLRTKANKWKIPIYEMPQAKMMKMSRNLNTQGMVMEVADFTYVSYADLLEEALAKKHTILFLDQLQDPQNLGAILRSLGCLGGFAVVLPSRESVGVTEASLRVACGGENFVSVCQVPNLNHAIAEAKAAGYWIVGAVVEGAEDLRSAELTFPLSLVIGSEEKGIRENIRKKLDFALTIPMAHERMSLNAAQAVSMFCYEINRQKERQK